MKFFIVLALFGLASATLNYNFNGRKLVLNGQNGYGNLLTSGSYGYGAGYGLTGYSAGLGLAKAYAPAYSSGLVLAQAAPVAKYGYASAAYAAPVATYAKAAYNGPITAAINSERSVQVVDVPSTGSPASPQSIVIGPSVNPLDFEFVSQSSPISVRQSHIPGTPNAPQYSSHQEEPDLLKQEIVKPIVHEVTEAIQPYRKVTQEVRPVQETISQLITRGQQQQVAYAAPVATAQYAAAPVAVAAVQPVQASYAVAQPVQASYVQTVAQPVQASYVQTVAQPALQYAAVEAPAYSTGYVAKPTLALTGSTSFASKPTLALSTSEVAAPDAYRK